MFLPALHLTKMLGGLHGRSISHAPKIVKLLNPMALINYLTRVHFGEGVLQEVIHAELERLNIKRPFVLVDGKQQESELREFTLNSIDSTYIKKTLFEVPDLPEEGALKDVAASYQTTKSDAIIAIGGSKVMHFAKLVRICIKHNENLERFSEFTGGQRLLSKELPLFIAAPDLSGIAPSISKYGRVLLKNGKFDLISSERLRADIAICDPLFTLNESSKDIAASTADAVVQCLEAFFAQGFNPPAEGIAIDGLRRIINNIDKLNDPVGDLKSRRELMTANLNGVLALEKGSGSCATITDFLMTRNGHHLSDGVIKRIVMTEILNNPTPDIAQKMVDLKSILKIDNTVADFFNKIFVTLGLPATFSDISSEKMEKLILKPINEDAHAHSYALPQECNTLLKNLVSLSF